MKLYNHDGWANMPDIIESETPFVLVISGRGTGKTYGGIKYLLEEKIPFIYLRRTASQMELVSKDEFSPIVKIGSDLGMSLVCVPLSKYASGVFMIDDDGKPLGEALAFNMALSTIANARSFDASRIKVILYDECIPERHERQTMGKFEDQAFLQMYESVNRNREMFGEPPVKCVCLANANNLEAPILQALNCIRILDNMKKKGQTQYVNKTLGLSVFLLKNSPISAEKRNTALYRLTLNQGDFNDMALDNEFSHDNYTDIANRPLSEYTPVASIGSICLYRHKYDYTWYVSETISGKPKEFENTFTDRQRFRLYCIRSWQDYFEKKVIFSNVTAKVFYKAVMMENTKG